MKHPGRWFWALFVALIVADLLAMRTFGAAAVLRSVLVVSVPGLVASLIVIERVQGARAAPLTLATTAIAAGAFAHVSGWSNAVWWQRMLLTVFIVMPLMSLANALLRRDVWNAQRRRDIEAAELVRGVRSHQGHIPPFVLYLRPFASTDRLPTQSLSFEFGDGEAPVHLDMETIFGRALAGHTVFVAIGHSGDISEGASRVSTSDEEWRELVAALAVEATFIVMVPLASPGTAWELQWLIEHGALNKVLFVMPETVGPTPSGVISTTQRNDRIFDSGFTSWDTSENCLDLLEEWPRAVEAASELGIALPPLVGAGALFTVTPDTGQVSHFMPLSLSTSLRRVRHLRAAIRYFGLDFDPPVYPQSLLDIFEQSVWFRGTTLAYALTRVADAFLFQGDTMAATEALRRAVKEDSGFVRAYLEGMSHLAWESDELNDLEGVERYRDSLSTLLAIPEFTVFARTQTTT